MRKLFILALLFTAPSAQADSGPGEIRIALMEFASKGGVEQQQMDAMSDLLAAEIRKLGSFRVIGKADIRAALKFEQDKQLLGCVDDSCLAEIGGALGVRWVVFGNVSKFEDTYLLNLKLMDVEQITVASRVSRKVPGGQGALLDAAPAVVHLLFDQARDRLPPGAVPPIQDTRTQDSLRTWGHVAFWSGLAATALGGVAVWQAHEAAVDYGYNGSQTAADRNALWNGLAPGGLALGGTLIVTGLVLWAVAGQPADTSSAVHISAGPAARGAGCSLSIGGGF